MTRLFLVMATLFVIVVATQVPVQASTQAAPQHNFGTGQGRITASTENDWHTQEWERFWFNYHFTSGSDHRFELGRPTTFDGQVPVCPFSVNQRRDAQVSLRPPSYGIFSGNFPTPPSNQFFQQPVNPHFHQPHHWHNTNLDPRFDTLQHGVNTQPFGNPMNVQTTGAPTNSPPNGSNGFLPPTSIN